MISFKKALKKLKQIFSLKTYPYQHYRDIARYLFILLMASLPLATLTCGGGDGGSDEDPVVQRVATPLFSPADGNVNPSDTLTISTATPEATIRYTTNGDDPTGSPFSGSSPLTLRFETLGTGDITIRAIAIKEGSTNSAIASATFNIGGMRGTPPRVATPLFSPADGDVNPSDTLTISTATEGATIHYTTDGSDPTESSPSDFSPLTLPPFGNLRAGTGDITIRAIAVRAGFANSDIASATFNIGSMGVTPPKVPTPTFSPTGGMVNATDTLTISTATLGATIHYTTNGDDPTESSPSGSSPLTLRFETLGTGDITIRAIAVRAGLTNSDIASATFNIGSMGVTPPKVAAPLFSPTGGMVNALDTLIISSDEGATIHYTTDGSDPTESSPSDFSPLTLLFEDLGTGNITIRAIAVREGLTNSDITTITFTIVDSSDVDADNNGLIEIRNLDMLNNIRYNLAGTSYDDEEEDSGADGDTGSTVGASTSEPANCNDDDPNTTITLCGYELTRSLDFANAAHYASGSVNTAWRPNMTNSDDATNEGFDGFGAETGTTGGFTGIFEGNGHSINNLYSRNAIGRTGQNIGLFRLLNSSAIVRNLGVTNVAIYGGGRSRNNVGSLAGLNNGTIIASIAIDGAVNGGDGVDIVGGLVGQNLSAAAIIASFSNVSPNGGDGSNDTVGGLLGNNVGTIIASYATGSPNGGDGNADNVGGLVGSNFSTIIASYATGDPNGGDGDGDNVGGLVGFNSSTITASYATGDPNGGDGNEDNVGGLVGSASFIASSSAGFIITASYATGNPTGGGLNDNIGRLMGARFPLLDSNAIIESYGFGVIVDQGFGYGGTMKPSGVTSASQLTNDSAMTNTYAGASWNSATNNTLGAWDFGADGTQAPALVYNDYDGATGTTYASCSANNGGFPTTLPGTSNSLTCGSTLVGGAASQGR